MEKEMKTTTLQPKNSNSNKSSKYVYESPLSVLDTIRTVSNVILGSTRSFDRVNNYFSQLEKAQANMSEEITLNTPPDDSGEMM